MPWTVPLKKTEHVTAYLEDKFGQLAGALALPAFVGVGARLLIVKLGEWHWTLGATAAGVLVIWVWLLIRGLTPAYLQKNPVSVGLGCFLLALALATSAFGGISYLLYQYNLLSQGEPEYYAYYASAGQITPDGLSNTYLWILADMVPSLHIPETVHWERPVCTTSPKSGAIELVFKVIVVLPLIAGVKAWLGSGKTAEQPKAA